MVNKGSNLSSSSFMTFSKFLEKVLRRHIEHNISSYESTPLL